MNNPKGCWQISVGAAILLFAIVGLMVNSFSVYLPFLLERSGLSNTQSANILLVRSIFAFGSLLNPLHTFPAAQSQEAFP